MHNTRQGFTLIELMVSIALMLLLIGIVMSIFNNSSTTVTMAEAKVEIFQNARTTFEAMAQEIADATEIYIYNDPPESMEHPNLAIKTISHWIEITEENSQKKEIKQSGEAVVQYDIIPSGKEINGEKLYLLRKIIFPKKENNNNNNEPLYQTIRNKKDENDADHPNILSEYLVHPVNPNDTSISQPTQNLPIYIERITKNNDNTSWSWNGESYQKRLQPAKINNQYGITWGYNVINENEQNANNSLPIAIRITMTFTDEFVRAKRTVSRVFWIPKGK